MTAYGLDGDQQQCIPANYGASKDDSTREALFDCRGSGLFHDVVADCVGAGGACRVSNR